MKPSKETPHSPVWQLGPGAGGPPLIHGRTAAQFGTKRGGGREREGGHVKNDAAAAFFAAGKEKKLT